jgi:hypothetical protein
MRPDEQAFSSQVVSLGGQGNAIKKQAFQGGAEILAMT